MVNKLDALKKLTGLAVDMDREQPLPRKKQGWQLSPMTAALDRRRAPHQGNGIPRKVTPYEYYRRESTPPKDGRRLPAGFLTRQ